MDGSVLLTLQNGYSTNYTVYIVSTYKSFKNNNILNTPIFLGVELVFTSNILSHIRTRKHKSTNTILPDIITCSPADKSSYNTSVN